jgi:hypothetical protein
MASRTIALAVVWLAASIAGGVELVLVEGQITEGGFFVSPEGPPFHVAPGSPVAYEGAFSYDAVDGVATFYFTPLVDDIDGTQLIDANLFPGVLQNDDAALVVDFDPPLQTLMNFFELSLDKATGQGEWSWFEDCVVCDRALNPFARATITSFREVLGGDFNEDGAVDGADLARWRAGVGSSGYPVHQRGDADGDLDVDGRDFSIWQRQVGMSLAATQATPEPSAGVLAVWVAAFFLRRKRVAG